MRSIIFGILVALIIGAAIPSASAGHGDLPIITSPVNGASYAPGEPVTFSAQGATGCQHTSTWRIDGVAFANGSNAGLTIPTTGLKNISFEVVAGGNGNGKGNGNAHCQEQLTAVAYLNINVVDVATIVVSPDGIIMSPSTQLTFTALGFDSSSNPVVFTPTWSRACTPVGGSITSAGNFTSPGVHADCTITASRGSVSDGTAVQVREPSVPVPQLPTVVLLVAGLLVLVGVAMRRRG